MNIPDTLRVTLTVCRHGLPLMEVHNLPGPDAELRPAQARALAAALIAAADQAEAPVVCGRRRRALPPRRITVALGPVKA